MSYVLIPLKRDLPLVDSLRMVSKDHPVYMDWSHYSQRGWCRMEMLVGRALAALGMNLRVYRFDAACGAGQLIEVPPYTPGSLAIMPTAEDAFFTCCQKDHVAAGNANPLHCDRKLVRPMEELFSREVSDISNLRRRKFVNSARGLLTIHPEIGGIVVVKATDFLKMAEIPRAGTGVTTTLQDEDLDHCRIVYFSNRFWRPGVHPDNESGLKMRWMQQVLRELVEQDGFDINSIYIWQDYSSIDQDDKKLRELGWDSIPGLVARSTYFVVFATDEKGNSAGALERAWIRRSVFVSRLLSAIGIYTASYVTKLANMQDLSGMTLEPLQSKAINIATYMDRAASTEPCRGDEGHKPSHHDPLCPWTGDLTDEKDRVTIRQNCEELLAAAQRLPVDCGVRQRMVERAYLQASQTTRSLTKTRSLTNLSHGRTTSLTAFSESPGPIVGQDSSMKMCRSAMVARLTSISSMGSAN